MLPSPGLDLISDALPFGRLWYGGLGMRRDRDARISGRFSGAVKRKPSKHDEQG